MTTITLDSNLDRQVRSIAQQAKATVDEIVNDILAKYLSSNNAEFYDLTDAYRAMAADTEREREADEWCNALIGDVANEAR
jgi:predicted site-specific integrase-resolvase